jgi:hypothetical protein
MMFVKERTTMTNVHTATAHALQSLQAKGARWVCVAAYAHAGHERGDILSWHKTYDAACRAAKGEFRRVNELAHIVDQAIAFEWAMDEARNIKEMSDPR